MAAPAPVVEGWFTTDPDPHLIGQRCDACATVVFPPLADRCPSPRCRSTDLSPTPLSRRGTVWSYTNAAYQPPSPYRAATDPYVPFGIVAVELDAEQLVVLGQLADGYDLDQLSVGQTVELVVETLLDDGEQHELTWRWRPVAFEEAEA